MTSERLTCVISGSFKFKPEIDEVYDELEDNGIKVLAPDKGWLYAAPQRSRILYPDGFRPLSTEKGMTPLAVENQFLKHLNAANLVYLQNSEGYIGEMTAFEIGNSFGANKPVYAHQSLEGSEFAVDDIGLWTLLKDYVRVVPIPDIVEDYYKILQTSSTTVS